MFAHQRLVFSAGVLGGFNRLSQHLNYGGVLWEEKRGGCNHQIAGHAFTKRPTHHLAAVHVYNDCQVQEACPRRYIGHVGNPQLVNAGGFELAPHQIRCSFGQAIALRGHHETSAPAHTPQACHAHQAFNTLVIDTMPHVPKLSLHPGTPIGVVACGVNLPNTLGHDLIAQTALAWHTVVPVVVAAC